MGDAARERADALAVLGLDPDATPAQIAGAYRRLARATHPDRCPDDGDAAVRFAALAKAYRRARVAPEPPPAPVPPPAPPPPPAVRRERPSSYLTSGPRGPDLVVGPVHVVPWPRAGRSRTPEEPG